MEENLINAFFVADVVRHGTLFVWQFLDNQIEHIEHASYHLYLVDMLMAHDVAYEMEDIENALVFVGGKAEAICMAYKLLVHHLYRNFRKERQIRFYADKLNVSTVYLSRLVKEISGTTVNDHATSLVYKEICNLLTHSDMTIGEIADYLNFSDQSALSKFHSLRPALLAH